MRQVVRCFLQNKENKFLLVKHIKAKNWSLAWWHLEENENMYEALHREIKEEFNFKIEILGNKIWFNKNKLNELNELPIPISIYNVKYNSIKHWLIQKQEYIFLAKIIAWNIKIQTEEIEEYNFFTKEEILKLDNTFEQIKETIKTL